MNKVNLAEKLAMFDETWSPKVIGSLNGQLLKLAKLEGEFVWHSHRDEDELFLVLGGSLTIRMRDREVTLEPGEFFIVPKGVEHSPVSPDGASVLLFEPEATRHTGDIVTDRTVTEPEWI